MTITDAMRIRTPTRPTTVNTRIVSLLLRLPGEREGGRERARGEERERECSEVYYCGVAFAWFNDYELQ